MLFRKAFDTTTAESRNSKPGDEIDHDGECSTQNGRSEQHRLQKRRPDFIEMHRFQRSSEMNWRSIIDTSIHDETAQLECASPYKRQRQRIGKRCAKGCRRNISGEEIGQHDCNNEMEAEKSVNAENTPTARPAATA